MTRRFILTLLAAVFAMTTFALADLPATAQEKINVETRVTVPAGGEATFDVNAFCLEYGEPFPDSVDSPSAMATDDVRQILLSAVKQGIAQSDPLQTNLAVWRQIEGTWGYDDDAVDRSVAESLLESGAAMSTDPLASDGTALDAAIADGSVTVTINDWANANGEKVFESDAPYYGSGSVVVTNTTDQELTLYYPVGMVLPAQNEAQQDMLSYSAQTRDPAPEGLPKTGAGDVLPLLLMLAGVVLVVAGLGRGRAAWVGREE